MEEVRKRIRSYITSGIIKTQGIKKLKKEFKISEQVLMDMWLSEKDKLEPPQRPGKMHVKSNYTYLRVYVKREHVDRVKEFVKSL